MIAIPNAATVSMLIGQTTRTHMLLLLLDERARTATELANATGISRSTASFHLSQLVEGRLLRIDRQGRHRYFRLASPDVAGLLQSLLVVADAPPPPEMRFGPRSTAMRQARMCYDHIAGELGIAIVESLLQSGALIAGDESFELTELGEHQLGDLGVDIVAARQRRRHFARTCIDWSERQPHLAGALGAALADRLFELSWIYREPEGRTLHVTPQGRQGLLDAFGLNYSTDGTT